MCWSGLTGREGCPPRQAGAAATRGHCRIAYKPPALGWPSPSRFGSASLPPPASVEPLVLGTPCSGTWFLGFSLFPATSARRFPRANLSYQVTAGSRVSFCLSFPEAGSRYGSFPGACKDPQGPAALGTLGTRGISQAQPVLNFGSARNGDLGLED